MYSQVRSGSLRVFCTKYIFNGSMVNLYVCNAGGYVYVMKTVVVCYLVFKLLLLK